MNQTKDPKPKMSVRSLSSLALLAAGLFVLTACASPDAAISTRVQAKLAADDIVKSAQIDVKTTNGVVTLTGNVDSERAKHRALELARGTHGAASVVDMIAARGTAGDGNAPEPTRTIGEAFDDAGITMSVKSLLLDDPQVKGLLIDVDTRDGIVFLTGTVVTDEERKKAIQLARDAKGVRDVQANLPLKQG